MIMMIIIFIMTSRPALFWSNLWWSWWWSSHSAFMMVCFTQHCRLLPEVPSPGPRPSNCPHQDQPGAVDQPQLRWTLMIWWWWRWWLWCWWSPTFHLVWGYWFMCSLRWNLVLVKLRLSSHLVHLAHCLKAQALRVKHNNSKPRQHLSFSLYLMNTIRFTLRELLL